ncbi:AAA family ATPase [Caenimonas koreensis DSM 17982]|uniref:AAA family ATPase n=1 Tax=Caenimonas koreensis DSM 17982 TaxID=1121255 RepID=A0A844BCG1_9BURK|nr:zeta toxin family protein [Caenimonas koreensis]MRD49349.1 AAA family ATPase [Caenimonas koreensis DSM 17982]
MATAAYQPLSDAEVREIASAYFSDRQAKTQAQNRPTIVLVGGQPGAGKSVAAAAVRSELAAQGGFIHVDADRMRERIRIGDSRPPSEQTQADAGRLVTSLRELAMQGRRNMVEEGTFRNADGAGKFIQSLREQGYRVELVAVATPREESLLGVYQRHEMQHAAGSNNPRFIAESYHDDALQGFDTTVAKTATQLDRVRVVNRTGELLYDSNSPRNSQGNAFEALATGRALSDAKLSALGKAWTAVEAAAAARSAPSAYLEAIAGHERRVQDMQKARIHDHAMTRLNANAATFARDSRFAQHTGNELVKAAYFRGFHEKAAQFHDLVPNFEKFDAKVADRAALGKLPDMGEFERPFALLRDRSEVGQSL